MDNNLKTVTIGIPAHNEEANIENLLTSITAQKSTSFVLERIIVACDGCTDKTAERANKFSRNDSRVEVIDDSRRVGKLKRLTEIYVINTSNIVIIFDADIVLAHENVVDEMVKSFDDPSVGLVSGNSQPVKAETFVGKVINAWSHVWYESRMAYRNGNNVHNSRGCCLALRKDLAQKVIIPEEIISDSQYLYFFCLSYKLAFKLAKKAVVLYRKPSNLNDYLIQTTRSDDENKKIARQLGPRIYQEYKIPTKYKFLAVIRCLINDPLFTVLGAGFNILSQLSKKLLKTSPKNQATWEMAQSTKKAIIN